MAVSAPIPGVLLSREIARIEQSLAEHGPTERRELARLDGARFWGPGRFPAALREAVLSGKATRIDRNRFGPPGVAPTQRFERDAEQRDEERSPR